MHKFPATLAGHSTSGDVFADYVHKSLADKKQNLVVFLQDKVCFCQSEYIERTDQHCYLLVIFIWIQLLCICVNVKLFKINSIHILYI